jgi:trehalose/maltose transport system substrate-binding protein
MRSLVVASLAAALIGTAASARAEKVTIVCGVVPQSIELCRSGSEAWAKARGHEVRVLSYPDSSTRARELIGDLLEAQAEDLDVLELDIVWPGVRAPHLLDLGSTPDLEAGGHFPAALASFTGGGGHLLAVPWYLSVGRLLYRTDLLERYRLAVPTKWEELAAAARTIQERERTAGNAGFWGFVWQGRVGEGLTANALEWITGAGAPGILGQDGAVVVDDPRSAIAIGQAASWVGTISPGAVLDMGGGDSLAAFIAGNAAFLRYWSNGLALANAADSKVGGKTGMTELPAGDGPDGRHVSILGGSGLAVSRHSRQPELAKDLVRWLTSPEEQKRRALAGPFEPSLQALYQDPELIAHKPYYPALAGAFETSTLRPAVLAGGNYDAVSQAVAATVHAVLEHAKQPEPALGELATTLRRLGPGRQRIGS